MSGSKLRAFLSSTTTKVLPTLSPDRSKQTASFEQIARETICESFLEEDPSVAEWFRDLVPSSQGVAEYVSELFPCRKWLGRYNVQWLMGDAVAGTY